MDSSTADRPDRKSSTRPRPATDLIILIVTSVLLRLAWLKALPTQAYSIDLKDWRIIAGELLVGMNPYQHFHLLNWPPFWMQTLYLLGRVCDVLHLEFFLVCRLFLIVAEEALLVSTYLLMLKLDPRQPIRRILLIGFCCNPVLILLTVQHCNFDAIPTTMIVWFLFWLIRFRRSGDPVDWLWAAAFLGLGAYVKTFPIVLAPLLVGEARRLSWKTRLLGAALCLGPAAISLAPLYVLSPQAINYSVITYRGVPGRSGVSGLLQIFNAPSATGIYAQFFSYLLPVVLVAVTVMVWHRALSEQRLVLLAFVLLLALFELGPADSPQYWFWVIPLLLVCFRAEGVVFRRWALGLMVVLSATLIPEYAFCSHFGRFFFWWDPTSFTQRISEWLDDGRRLSLVCLPLFSASVAMVVYSGRLIASGLYAKEGS